jgi:hypothetical protein
MLTIYNFDIVFHMQHIDNLGCSLHEDQYIVNTLIKWQCALMHATLLFYSVLRQTILLVKGRALTLDLPMHPANPLGTEYCTEGHLHCFLRKHYSSLSVILNISRGVTTSV